MTFNTIVKKAIAIIVATAASGASAQECIETCYSKRWIYFGGNLLVPDVNTKFLDLIAPAKASGFNGIALNLGGFGSYASLIAPNSTSAHKQALIATLQNAISQANQAGLEVIPVSGHPTAPLSVDPLLQEAFPTTTLYQANAGTALPVAGAVNLITNPGFETGAAGIATGWAYDNGTGEGGAHVDATVGRSGRSMLIEGRLSNFTGYAQVRLFQQVVLKPHSAYRFSFWLKAGPYSTPDKMLRLTIQDFDANNRAIPLYAFNESLGWGSTDGAYNASSNSTLFAQQVNSGETGWKQYSVDFNSGNRSKAYVYLSIPSLVASTSKVWVDDVEVREIGITHPLERGDGFDYAVTSEDGLTNYLRYQDYDISGQQLIVHHPAIQNAKLKVSWRHSPEKIIYGAPAIACGNEGSGNGPYFDIQLNLYNTIASVFSQQSATAITGNPRKYFMYYDEIPMMNWEKNPSGCSLPSAGDYLGRMVRGVQDRLPGTVETLTWNDMFDPNMNGVANYHQVNGSLAKANASDYNLDPATVIVNWTGGGVTDTVKQTSSLAYFQGFRQVVALYYDNLSSVNSWLDAVSQAGTQTPAPQIDGVMYTTWKGNYSELNGVAAKIRNSPLGVHWPSNGSSLTSPSVQPAQ